MKRLPAFLFMTLLCVANASGGQPDTPKGSAGLAFRGALVHLTSDKPMGGTSYIVSWDAADYDTNGFWSPDTPTELTVPSGATYCRLYGGVAMTADAVALIVQFAKGGDTAFAGNATNFVDAGAVNTLSVSSPVIPCRGGNDFELVVTADKGRTVGAFTATYFGIEVVQ